TLKNTEMLPLQKIRSNIVHVNEPLSNEESHTSKRISTNEGSGHFRVRNESELMALPPFQY
ncbi:hypothetical protein, partial [Vibrio cyclitrophicus]|uniref:hypothetical protein n=1 Tax=Vibrio cyclitrophicus TaxID=47951 RepID=UPI001A7E0747